MNKQTATILKKCGIQPHLLGYDYLGEAIEMVLEDRRNLRLITKAVYPQIAKKYDTAPSRVERAIRHAITRAFDSPLPGTVYEIFGNTIDPRTGKPTNSQFIAAVSELVE